MNSIINHDQPVEAASWNQEEISFLLELHIHEQRQKEGKARGSSYYYDLRLALLRELSSAFALAV